MTSASRSRPAAPVDPAFVRLFRRDVRRGLEIATLAGAGPAWIATVVHVLRGSEAESIAFVGALAVLYTICWLGARRSASRRLPFWGAAYGFGAVAGAVGSVTLSHLLPVELMVGFMGIIPVACALYSVAGMRWHLAWIAAASGLVALVVAVRSHDPAMGFYSWPTVVAWTLGSSMSVLVHEVLERNRRTIFAAVRLAHRGRGRGAAALRQLRAVEAIGRALSEHGTTAAVLDAAMVLMEDEFGYRYPSIYIGDDQVMTLGAHRNYTSPIHRFDRSRGIIGRVMRTHQAVLVTDVRRDADYMAASEAVRSELCVPLLAGGRFLGVINIESPTVLGQDDLASMAIVADRFAAAISLAQRHSALQEVLDASPLPIVVFDADETISYWNRAATEAFGWSSEELVGRPTPLIPGGDTATPFWTSLVTTGEQVNGQEMLRRHKDGHLVPVRIFATRYGDHEPYGVIALCQDLSAERAAANALAESTNRFETVIGALREGVLVQAADGQVSWANPAAERLLGRVAGSLTGRFTNSETLHLVHEDGRQMTPAEHPGWQAFATGAPVSGTVVGVVPDDGETTWLLVDSIPLRRNASEDPYGVVSSLTDITERIRHEEELRLSANRLGSILEQSADGILGVSLDGAVTFMNEAACAVFGYDPGEMIGQSVELLVPDGATGRHAVLRGDYAASSAPRSAARGRRVEGRRVEGRRKDGSVFPADVALSPVEMPGGTEIYATVTDLTERLRIEAELLQAAKMDSIGRLAGGIAHDFNNVLTAIVGYSETVRAELAPDSEAHADMDQVLGAANRAAQLTRQLLGFARKTVLDPGVHELNAIVAGLEPMLRRLLGEQVALVTHLDPSAGHVRVDRSQMDQVLVNLAVNARDAMPDGGTLVIDTGSAAAADVDGPADVDPAGRLAILRVSDTGVGMGPEVLRDIFLPFYTTKPFGEGTGLGLATTHGIVNQSGGTITVSSEIGRGTVFTILLPTVAPVTPVPSPAPAEQPHREGKGTVLVVEDEESVRALVTRMLERSGYRVLGAPNGASALELVGTRLAEVDLLLTDVVMPGMRGPELAATLQAGRPGLPVVFMSGYLGPNEAEDATLAGAPMLTKPFELGVLIAAIAEGMAAGGLAGTAPAETIAEGSRRT